MIGAIIFLSFSAARAIPNRSDGASNKTGNAVAAIKESTVYTVREHCGRIGIFEDGYDEPSIILDVYVFTLPEKDKEMLKEGFTVNESSLGGVIEDYTG